MKIFILVVILVLAAITLGYNSYIRSRDLKDISIRILLMLIVLTLVEVFIYGVVLPGNWNYVSKISPFSFLFVPLMYFLIHPDYKGISDKVVFYHRIPFYISILCYIPFVVCSEIRNQWGASFYLYWNSALFISFLFYSFLALHSVGKRGGVSKQPLFSKINIFLYFSLTMTFGIYVRKIYLDYSITISSYVLILLLLLIMINIYQQQLRELKRINSARIAEDTTFQSMLLDTIKNSQIKIDPSLVVSSEEPLLSQAAEINLLEQLDFLDPDLSLQSQALKLGMTTSQLSKEIKRLTGETFLNYINRLRINYATDKLQEYPNMDIDILLSNSGFNSRASFYRNFKKYTDTTPIEFIKKQQT